MLFLVSYLVIFDYVLIWKFKNKFKEKLIFYLHTDLY